MITTRGNTIYRTANRPEVKRVVLCLPLPPGLNNLFANRASGGRFTAKRYAAWKTEAGWELIRQRPGRVGGAYRIMIEVGPSRIDLDSAAKAPIDLLVSHGVVDGDGPQFLREVVLRLADGVEGIRVVISRFTRDAR